MSIQEKRTKRRFFKNCLYWAQTLFSKLIFCAQSITYGHTILKNEYKDRILTLVSFTNFMFPSGCFASVLMVVLLALVSVWRSSSLVLCCKQMFATNATEFCHCKVERKSASKTLYLLYHLLLHVRVPNCDWSICSLYSGHT